MKWSDFETRIKPAMLNGKSYIVTIARIVQEQVHPQPNTTETGVVLYFRETDKSLVLNAANRRTLWGMFGDDAQACVGQRVTLFAEPRTKTDSRLTIRIGPANDKPTAARQVDTATGEITGDVEAEPLPTKTQAAGLTLMQIPTMCDEERAAIAKTASAVAGR